MTLYTENKMKKKLRILVLAQMVYPDYIGGAAKVAYEQALYLKKQGHEVTIVTLKKHRYYPDQETINGLVYFRYDNILYRKTFGRSITARLSLKTHLNRIYKLGIRFDATIMHYPHDAVSFHKSKFKDLPATYIFHAPSIKELKIQGLDRERRMWWIKYFRKPFTKWTNFCENTAVKKASALAVMSQFMRMQLLTTHEELKGKKHVHILSSGINLNLFSPINEEKKQELRKELNIKKNEIVFISIRRLVERMGIDNLIDATKLLVDEYPKLRLKILGEGLLKEKIKQQIKRLKLEKVITLIGIIPRKKLVEAYQSADCFVLPTKALEGLGISTLEALACRLPAMGTPAGATPEILENINPKLLFRSIRPEHIALGMKWFIDEGINLNLGEKGRKYVEKNHNWNKITAHLEEILNETIKAQKMKK